MPTELIGSVVTWLTPFVYFDLGTKRMFVNLLNLSSEKVFLNELLLKDQLACLREIDAQAEIIDKSDYRIQNKG